MRALSGPALVSQKFSSALINPLINTNLSFIASPRAATLIKVLASGELIGDILPNTPDRIEPQSLVFRMASGAVCGALLSRERGASAGLGGVLGAAGALVGTFAFFHIRRYLSHQQGIPDPILAVVEDAITYGAGWAVVN